MGDDMGFLSALLDPTMPLLRYAVITGLLASVAFGVVGSYVVARRISYLAGAIAHSALGGIGLALWLKHERGLTWMEPLWGAVAAALLAAVILGLVSLYAQEREDTVISALWVVGMSAGILFINAVHEQVSPMPYLFGEIVLVTQRDVVLVAVLDVLVLSVALLLYNQFLGVCFDEEYARLRGVPVKLIYLLLLCLTALTVVLMSAIIGIIMVIALLTLPAAIGSQFGNRLWQMMVWSSLLCMLFTCAGMVVSYQHDLATGPTIVLIAGAVYLLVTVVAKLRKPAAPVATPGEPAE